MGRPSFSVSNLKDYVSHHHYRYKYGFNYVVKLPSDTVLSHGALFGLNSQLAKKTETAVICCTASSPSLVPEVCTICLILFRSDVQQQNFVIDIHPMGFSMLKGISSEARDHNHLRIEGELWFEKFGFRTFPLDQLDHNLTSIKPGWINTAPKIVKEPLNTFL